MILYVLAARKQSTPLFRREVRRRKPADVLRQALGKLLFVRFTEFVSFRERPQAERSGYVLLKEKLVGSRSLRRITRGKNAFLLHVAHRRRQRQVVGQQRKRHRNCRVGSEIHEHSPQRKRVHVLHREAVSADIAPCGVDGIAR